jgi:hypothetical protein
LRINDYINNIDENGDTPLTLYLKNNNIIVENLKLLISKQNINIKNKDGKIPSMYIDFENINFINTILTNTLSYNLIDDNGDNLLMGLFSNYKILDYSYREEKIIFDLIGIISKTNLNMQNKNKKNVLMLAAESKNYKNYPELLKKLKTEINIYQEDKWGRMVIHYGLNNYFDENDKNLEIEKLNYTGNINNDIDLYCMITNDEIPYGNKYYKCKNKGKKHLIDIEQYKKWIEINWDSSHNCLCGHQFDTKKQFLNINKLKFKINKFLDSLLNENYSIEIEFKF